MKPKVPQAGSKNISRAAAFNSAVGGASALHSARKDGHDARHLRCLKGGGEAAVSGGVPVAGRGGDHARPHLLHDHRRHHELVFLQPSATRLS